MGEAPLKLKAFWFWTCNRWAKSAPFFISCKPFRRVVVKSERITGRIALQPFIARHTCMVSFVTTAWSHSATKKWKSTHDRIGWCLGYLTAEADPDRYIMPSGLWKMQPPCCTLALYISETVQGCKLHYRTLIETRKHRQSYRHADPRRTDREGSGQPYKLSQMQTVINQK